jgi:hypothetical protein
MVSFLLKSDRDAPVELWPGSDLRSAFLAFSREIHVQFRRRTVVDSQPCLAASARSGRKEQVDGAGAPWLQALPTVVTFGEVTAVRATDIDAVHAQGFLA